MAELDGRSGMGREAEELSKNEINLIPDLVTACVRTVF